MRRASGFIIAVLLLGASSQVYAHDPSGAAYVRGINLFLISMGAAFAATTIANWVFLRGHLGGGKAIWVRAPVAALLETACFVFAGIVTIIITANWFPPGQENYNYALIAIILVVYAFLALGPSAYLTHKKDAATVAWIARKGLLRAWALSLVLPLVTITTFFVLDACVK